MAERHFLESSLKHFCKISRSACAAIHKEGYWRVDTKTIPETRQKFVNTGERYLIWFRAKKHSTMPATNEDAKIATGSAPDGLEVDCPKIAKHIK